MQLAEALLCVGVQAFFGIIQLCVGSMCCAAIQTSPDICVAFYRLDVKTHSMAQACPSARSQGVQPASQSADPRILTARCWLSAGSQICSSQFSVSIFCSNSVHLLKYGHTVIQLYAHD